MYDIVCMSPDHDLYAVLDLDGTTLYEGGRWECCGWLSDYLDARKDWL